MSKSQIFLAALPLVLLASRSGGSATALAFKEERLVIEYTATAGEAALVMSAESESPLGYVELRDPLERNALRLQAGQGRDLSLSGFVVESRESTLEKLLASYPEGRYDFAGRTVSGRAIFGGATFEHAVPRPVRILWPLDGAEQVATQGLVVAWEADPSASGFHVILEQGESDGLSVQLPAGTDSLEIPSGVLAQSTETLLEIAAIGTNGNRTLVEIQFTTR